MNIHSIQDIHTAVLNERLNDGSGYMLAQIAEQDLAELRGLVRDQYLHAIQTVAPAYMSQYAAKPMDDYHHIYQPEHFEHGKLWSKPSRMLGPHAVQVVQNCQFFQCLRDLFSQVLISDEENFGWPGIYWRLVRPGNTDIGPLHADKWFWDLGHGQMPDGYYRVKVWMSLFSEAGKSGLRVIPGSQLRDDWKYHGEMRNGMMKPVFDEQEADLDILNLPMNAGQMVIFHDKLLHGGMPNKSETSRVSLELTLLVPA